MQTVDVPHEGRMDRIADQLTDALGQVVRDFRRHGEAHIFKLPTPANAVLWRDDQPRTVRAVGPATVPERSFGDRQRPRRHRHLDRVRPVADLAHGGAVAEVGRLHRTRYDLAVPEMAARNDLCRAVQLGGVVDCPESADPERWPRPRDLRAAVVEMPGLHGLAGLQVDREQRRQQAALAQLRLNECHYKRMHHEPCKRRRFCQQRVDAIGLHAFKFVTALEIACQMRRQRGADFGDTVLRQNTLKDQVTAAVELVPPGRERSSSKPGSNLLLRHGCHWPLSRTALSPLSQRLRQYHSKETEGFGVRCAGLKPRTDKVRFYELEGDRLTISRAPAKDRELGGAAIESVWELQTSAARSTPLPLVVRS